MPPDWNKRQLLPLLHLQMGVQLWWAAVGADHLEGQAAQQGALASWAVERGLKGGRGDIY